MAAPQQKPQTSQDKAEESPESSKIDPSASAGSRNSLGEESIRDGRPTTDDRTIEAIDEEDLGNIEPPFR